MNWSADKEEITQKYFELINLNNLQLFGILKDYIEDSRPVLPLIEFIISRLEAITVLAVGGRLWDADIIMRSALETFTKFLFITKAVGDEQTLRIDEFWNQLPEIYSLKLSDQARRNLEFAGGDEMVRLAYLPLILAEDEEQKLRGKWPKATRQKLEQKWSFSEMIAWIAKSGANNSTAHFITLTHSYRMGSHISHGDETGVSIVKECEGRSPEERMKAESGHYLRLFSDSLAYCAMVGMDSMSFVKQPKKAALLYRNSLRIAEVEGLISKHKGRVYDDPDYDKFRKNKE